MLINYQIPIVCEYNGMFHKSIYLECEECPSFDKLFDLLLEKHSKEVKMSEEHPDYGPYSFEYEKATKSMMMFAKDRGIEEFPRVGDRLYLSSCVFWHEELGSQSICCYIVVPISC